ncbi:AlpA family phage regulatory protein [Sphingomonas sp. ABOLE]|nr:AlpA family phage regulatory protein [Sphingomonas sp. ABOLE]
MSELMPFTAPTTHSGRLLKMTEVRRETSLHPATIYRQMQAGTFPNRCESALGASDSGRATSKPGSGRARLRQAPSRLSNRAREMGAFAGARTERLSEHKRYNRIIDDAVDGHPLRHRTLLYGDSTTGSRASAAASSVLTSALSFTRTSAQGSRRRVSPTPPTPPSRMTRWDRPPPAHASMASTA